MAGGTWTSQNKKIPGVYINVKSWGNVSPSIGDSGVVAIAEPLSWGPSGTVQEIIPGEDLRPYIGYDVTHEKAIFLREMMKGSDRTAGPNKILLYRLAGTGGAKATATIGALTVTALYDGVRGNDITVIVEEQVDTEETYDVSTIIDGRIADTQSVSDLSKLTANAWVTFSGTGTEIQETAGEPLKNGKAPTVSPADFAAFLSAIEPYRFDILVYDGSDSTTIQAFAAFVKRISDSIGQKCQAVMAGSSAAGCNSEYVIALKNGVVLDDGTRLTAEQATWWVAGAEAGAKYNQSLTHAQYVNVLKANPKLKDTEVTEAVGAGYICFIDEFDAVKICTDINSLTSFSVDKGEEFSKNRVIRVLMKICNDVYKQFSIYYVGKINNNKTGRDLLKGWMVGYLNEIQANEGIQNFVTDDVVVNSGKKIDTIVIDVAIQPVDSVEKIYMTITVSVNAETEEE